MKIKYIILLLMIIHISFINDKILFTKEYPQNNKKALGRDVKAGDTTDSDRNKTDDDNVKKNDASGGEEKNTGEKKLSGKDDKNKNDFENDEKKAKYIEDTLEFGIHSDRIDALNKIKTIKNETIKKKIFEKLIKIIENESDSDLKTKAIYIASEQNIKDAIPAISKCISDDDDETVIASAFALKNLKGVSAKEKLIAKLKEQDFSKNSNKTEAIIQALGEFKAGEIIGLATETIKNPKTSKINREAFVLFLGQMDTQEPKDILLELYKNPEEDLTIRAYSVNALSKLGVKDSAKEIIKVVSEIDSYSFKKKTKYYTLYIYSISALALLGDESVIPKLIESLKSNNPQVRIKTIKLIKDLKDKRTIDILKYKMKNDPNLRVRKEAENALKEIEEMEKETKSSPDNKTNTDEKLKLKPENKKTEKAEPKTVK